MFLFCVRIDSLIAPFNSVSLHYTRICIYRFVCVYDWSCVPVNLAPTPTCPEHVICNAQIFAQAFVPIKNSDRRAFARGAPAHHVHASLERIGMYVRAAVAGTCFIDWPFCSNTNVAPSRSARPIQEAQIKDLLDVLEIEAFTDPGASLVAGLCLCVRNVVWSAQITC